MIIKEIISPIRNKQSRYGTRKLHLDILPKLRENNIKMGRDAFFDFMRQNQMLVKKTKRFHITTDSNHGFHKSPNLIKDFTPTAPEQVWVSDITYISIGERHGYLALVTDLYSKQIMGYSIDLNMKVKLVKNALQMALGNRIYNNSGLIHHSDRGRQYCCPEFVEMASDQHQIRLSTTQNSDPYENAVAERINGILKYEFGLRHKIPSLELAKKIVKEAVTIYNNERRHCSLEMQTPKFAHINARHKYKSYKKSYDRVDTIKR